MTIEILELTLPNKGSNELQSDYKKRTDDARWSSKVTQTASIRAFEYSPKDTKGHDAINPKTGGQVEHKGMTENTHFRASSYTGRLRICYPTAVKESCDDKEFLISCVKDVARPFAVSLPPDVVQLWRAQGFIDPLTGRLSREDFFALIKPYDLFGLVPFARLNSEAATKRTRPLDMAERLRRTFQSWLGIVEREKRRVERDIAELDACCQQQQETHGKVSTENSVPRMSHGDE